MVVDRSLESCDQFLHFVVILRGQEPGTQVANSIFSCHMNVPAKG